MEYITEGGGWMWVLVALDVVGVGLILTGLVAGLVVRFVGWFQRVSRLFTFVVLLGALLPAAAGAMGWRAQRSAAWAHAAAVDPEARVAMLEHGYEVAQYPLVFGIGSTLVLGFCALMPFILTLPPVDP